ncbi:beta-galactosidase 17 [Arabidopsis thaliana]|uniref:Isoform 2 of Beta-galactosidase 17 n=1 Tax=Arabidopsis thaliana TaxID=3702 RepID=Q93Z24-2|nr:beta-galactosidase 17 [Arabidopsis thaliana]AEE35401.1 beta-galactosidase 17 [Arabidopsis thaliana]|eukprot:NP_001031273.1 beta-galactosidase 17 [Arabidopsis thaliana]
MTISGKMGIVFRSLVVICITFVFFQRLWMQYWEDRLLRANALGLNTIQVYVPWNLHEPKPGKMVFEGIGDLVSFLKLCEKLDFLVMLRAGPYICGEWDLGGFPAWLLAVKPRLQLRTSDPVYLKLVERWWDVLLPKVFPLLYSNGGPVIMVQIENEYGSYGNDKAYLRKLVSMARGHLGDDIIVYTTDGGTKETLDKGTVPVADVYSAVDFSTGDDPWPIFKLQKKFNAPGRSPPLSSEFYTGWLTHWGEKITKTDAEFTAASLEKILSRNGSAVLYMVHGGTNFGFYNGANTGSEESDYKPDLTSYDYDAPIKESGDIDNPKFQALQRVIKKYNASPHPISPSNKQRKAYGSIKMQMTTSLFDLVRMTDPADVITSANPISMESVGQMFGFLLYESSYIAKKSGNTLRIPKVHDRAQVFVSCLSQDVDVGVLRYIGTTERWNNQPISLPTIECTTNTSLFILVENMGRVNYGPYIFDDKGILSSVYLDGQILHGWKMIPIPFHNLNQEPNLTFEMQHTKNRSKKFELTNDVGRKEPALFAGEFSINSEEEIKDTYLSFNGWGKGVAFVNEFNIGRYWPSVGPQCNLYVPAPLLKRGKNTLVVFELESPHLELSLEAVDHQDFTCGSNVSKVNQL